MAVMTSPREIYTDPKRDAECLPTGWKRIDIPDPVAIMNEHGDSRLSGPSGGNREIHNVYAMSPEVREWCREQFNYEPVLYTMRKRVSRKSSRSKRFTITYSTVFTDTNHAVTFTLQWL